MMKTGFNFRQIVVMIGVSVMAAPASAQWISGLYLEGEGYLGRNAYDITAGGFSSLGRADYGYPAINLGAVKEFKDMGLTLDVFLTTGPEGRANITSASGNKYKAAAKASGHGFKLTHQLYDTGWSPVVQAGYRQIDVDMNFITSPASLTNTRVDFEEALKWGRLGVSHTGSTNRWELGVQRSWGDVNVNATAQHTVLGAINERLALKTQMSAAYLNYGYRFSNQWRATVEGWSGKLDTNINSHPWGGSLRVYRAFQ
jgi:hypothetical protein